MGNLPAPFQPTLGVVIWTWIVFIALFILLTKLVFPQIVKATADREAQIKKDLEDAERLRDESAAALAEQRELLASARGEAKAIVAEAREAADRERAAGGREDPAGTGRAARAGPPGDRRRARQGGRRRPARGGRHRAVGGRQGGRRPARRGRRPQDRRGVHRLDRQRGARVRDVTIARNYAEALLALAAQQRRTRGVGRAESTSRRRRSATPSIEAVLMSPRVPRERKVALVSEALAGRTRAPSRSSSPR